MDLSKDLAKSNFRSNISVRKRRGKIGQTLFFSSMIIAMIALASLLYNVGIESFGLVAVEYENDPARLADRPLEALSKEELIVILQDNVSKGLFRRFNNDMPFDERTSESVLALIQERVVAEEVLASYPLNDALFRRDQIEQEVSKKYPDATLRWKSWLSIDFLTTPMSSTAWLAGVRTAILGSLWMISITMLIAVPIGIGAAGHPLAAGHFVSLSFLKRGISGRNRTDSSACHSLNEESQATTEHNRTKQNRFLV